MVTYDNYYGINEATTPEKYEVVANTNLTSMLRFLTSREEDELRKIGNYEPFARLYLQNAGMTTDEVNALVRALTE